MCGCITDLQMAGADPPAAEPVHDHDKEIDKQERKAIQIGKPAVGPNGGLRILGKCRPHAVFFPGFGIESADDPHAGDVFQQDDGHPVQQLLQPFKQRGGAFHNKQRQDKNHRYHGQQDQSHLDIQAESQRQSDDKNHRHRQHHLDKAGQGELDGGDVGYRPGGDGGGSKLAEVVDRKFQGFVIDRHPHVPAHPGGQSSAGITA